MPSNFEKNVIKEYEIELTPEQKRQVTKLSSIFDKNQKLSWTRKSNKLEMLMEELQPYEEEIQKIMVKRQSIIEKIDKTRTEMIAECVHPRKMIIFDNDGCMICKFCDSKLAVKKDVD